MIFRFWYLPFKNLTLVHKMGFPWFVLSSTVSVFATIFVSKISGKNGTFSVLGLWKILQWYPTHFYCSFLKIFVLAFQYLIIYCWEATVTGGLETGPRFSFKTGHYNLKKSALFFISFGNTSLLCYCYIFVMKIRNGMSLT